MVKELLLTLSALASLAACARHQPPNTIILEHQPKCSARLTTLHPVDIVFMNKTIFTHNGLEYAVASDALPTNPFEGSPSLNAHGLKTIGYIPLFPNEYNVLVGNSNSARITLEFNPANGIVRSVNAQGYGGRDCPQQP